VEYSLHKLVTFYSLFSLTQTTRVYL